MLNERWKRLWTNLRVTEIPQQTFDELTAAYSAPGRFYHNLTHVEECLRVFDEGRRQAFRPDEIELAIWFHDAVYDPRSSENERKSAEWASRIIMKTGLSGAIAQRVVRLILATRHTEKPIIDRDTQILIDVDLSILGSEPEVFWEYERNIRKEYAFVPEAVFREKRAEILREFLRREYIYHLETYRNKYEEQARENIRQAISKLEDSSPDTMTGASGETF